MNGLTVCSSQTFRLLNSSDASIPSETMFSRRWRRGVGAQSGSSLERPAYRESVRTSTEGGMMSVTSRGAPGGVGPVAAAESSAPVIVHVYASRSNA